MHCLLIFFELVLVLHLAKALILAVCCACCVYLVEVESAVVCVTMVLVVVGWTTLLMLEVASMLVVVVWYDHVLFDYYLSDRYRCHYQVHYYYGQQS